MISLLEQFEKLKYSITAERTPTGTARIQLRQPYKPPISSGLPTTMNKNSVGLGNLTNLRKKRIAGRINDTGAKIAGLK